MGLKQFGSAASSAFPLTVVQARQFVKTGGKGSKKAASKAKKAKK